MIHFKVGDQVRAIRQSSDCEILEGKVYTVIGIDRDFIDVGKGNHYVPDMFVRHVAEDCVNSPSHYMLLPGVEVKDVRAAILSKLPKGIDYNAVDEWSRAWEYLTRMWGKNGLEDAKKARVYLDWLIKTLEGGK